MPPVERIAVRFEEAIAFLRDRLGLTEADWRALMRGVETVSLEISEDTEEAMRRDLLEAVLKAIEEGKSAEAFRADYDRIVQEYGWSFDGDPGWHSNLIFRVQTANAQAAGRWAQIQRLKATRPYIRYVTAGDHRVRPDHRLWNGVVLPADHPFWLTHFPPNGFNCRCIVQSVSERDLVRYGWSVTPDSDVALTVPPDEGWEGNVGLTWERLGGLQA